jgi:methyl-accepting chemotaxis protein
VISEGREDVNTIAHSLEQIRAAVGEAAARSEDIFQEADNQARDAERMVQSTEEFSKVVRTGAAAVDEVAGISQRQLASMSEVVASSRDLAELSEELRSVTQRFRTDAGGRP